ncbi:carbohydrate kinase [Gracilibacillus salitolerans]|uniref:Carbohydrate kinase n=1 Tax=Gracilibacillus salitolerans TaxID=2663022 RepID=A0A5Q2TPR9_9BACI|nr:carbohydrate kinase [Gracilibacillus salitolerans]QGH36826.1 carbohydrate kinase [Gracilibacillus salitolerans]
MKKVYTIGEALIDFIPHEVDVSMSEVESFKKVPGGAPANVAATIAKLGGKSAFIGQVGEDMFGYYLKNVLAENRVDVTHMLQTNKANTALAFVALKQGGEREFAFYRKPSADMLLEREYIRTIPFTDHDILHFCSVSLIESEVKYAHIEAIKKIKEEDGLVVFDPNVRQNLWDNQVLYAQTIQAFIPYADILKVSDEELRFITGEDTEEEGINHLLSQPIQLLILTKGKKGVTFFIGGKKISVPGFDVHSMDTTGAGDSFIGAFLYQFSLMDKKLTDLTRDELVSMGTFANAVAAMVTTKHGAISALPTTEEVETFVSGK